MAITEEAINSIALVTVLSVLATLAVIARVMLRRRGLLGVDDYILCFALVPLWMQAAAAYIIGIKMSQGQYLKMLSPSKMTWLSGLSYAGRLNVTILLTVVKTSILISYKRIFGHNKLTLTQIHVLLGLSWSWGISTFITSIFLCTPIARAWNPILPGTCIDLKAFVWGTSISSFIIDWMILFVPIMPVWRLRITTAQKVLVGGSFAFGSVACVASTVRAVSTKQSDPNDIHKSVFQGSIWTFIEPCLGMISACLPFLSSAVGNKIIRMPNPLPLLRSKFSAYFCLGDRTRLDDGGLPLPRHNNRIIRVRRTTSVQVERHNSEASADKIELTVYSVSATAHGHSERSSNAV